MKSKECLHLQNSSNVPNQLIFQTLDGSEITIEQQARQQRATNLGKEGYPLTYAKITKFDPAMHT